MKFALIVLSLVFSAQVFACSCSYDYGTYSKEILTEMATKVGVANHKDIKILDWDIEYTALSSVIRDRHCGCSAFVRKTWDIFYVKGDQVCEAKAVLKVWNNKMKIKDIHCK